MKKLKPEIQAVVDSTIEEVLSEYNKQSKLYNADSLHYLRSQITQKVHEKVGKNEIINIDVGLDLTDIDIKYFFKVNIPKDKTEELMESNATI